MRAGDQARVTVGVAVPPAVAFEVFTQEIDLSNLRWVLDTADDLRFLSWVYAELYPAAPAFSSVDVYRLLSRHHERIRFGPSVLPEEVERARLRQRIDADLLACGPHASGELS